MYTCIGHYAKRAARVALRLYQGKYKRRRSSALSSVISKYSIYVYLYRSAPVGAGLFPSAVSVCVCAKSKKRKRGGMYQMEKRGGRHTSARARYQRDYILFYAVFRARDISMRQL